MKLFKVSIDYAFVLAAETQAEADCKAYSYAIDALKDCTESTINISVEDYARGALCDWDDSLEPYAGDGKTTGEYLLETI